MKTSSKAATDITLRSPADLLSAIPYLVGYVPSDSIVLVGLARKHIAMTMRADLPRCDEPVNQLAISPGILRRNKVEAAVVAGYGDPERVTRCIDRLRQLLDRENIQVVDALRVTDGRYWSYVCHEPTCCPPQGNLVNDDASAVDAAFALGGVQALPDRQSVTAQLEPVDGAVRQAVTRATNQLKSSLSDGDAMVPADDCLRSEGHGILTRVLSKGAALPQTHDIVRLCAALADPALQGEALALTDAHGPHKTLDLWVWLTRHAAPSFRAVPAALLAFAAWRCGNGALAGEAVRRALADDPCCTLAEVLGHMLDAGVPPATVPGIQSLMRSSPE